MKQSSWKLWYTHEAKEWVEALPMGNGHMGAMAYGGGEGRYDLSETTCWSGKRQESCIDSKAVENMEQARALLIQGDIEGGETLIKKCVGQKENYGTQVPLGRAWVGVEGEVECQYRGLNLYTGIGEDKLKYNETQIKRTSFISSVDRVMVIKLDIEEGILPEVRVWIEGFSEPSHTMNNGRDLIVKGRALENVHSDGLHGVSYFAHMRIITEGSVEWSRKGLIVKNAKEIVVVMTAMTDMFDTNPEQVCLQRIEEAEQKGWENLLKRHYDEHTGWMGKCELKLSANPNTSLPTDERIRKYKEDPTDQELVALFFQYGRYLLIGSSRPDSDLPAALQGIWNDNRACRMDWTNDMHLDINTQMNYFPAEMTGLGECCQPLFRWLEKSLVPEGYKMAKELYQSNGWCAHTISNAWGWAAPGWGHSWGFNVTGGAWIATHLWQHYLYTEDKHFLRRVYPMLKGAVEFIYELLMWDEESGYMVTVPSYSPENSYYGEDGKVHQITIGATVDTSITKYLFNALLEANKILGEQNELETKIRNVQEKLKPFAVGTHGELMEWYKPFKEENEDHRHTSHLLALYPFNLINVEDSQELIEAVKVSIKRRLGKDAKDIIWANWAGALLVLYYARLQEGDQAVESINPMITFLSRENMMITHEGPTTSNTGGIYELDGNTGLTAGIVEMLLQSHKGDIHVLPAIPKSWTKGRVKGLVAQKGYRVDIEWDENELTRIEVEAVTQGEVLLRYKESKYLACFSAGQKKQFVYRESKIVQIG